MYLPVHPSNRKEKMFDNLWTYIGYFRQHFPNDWSTNCRPMDVALSTNQRCVLVAAATTPWRLVHGRCPVRSALTKVRVARENTTTNYRIPYGFYCVYIYVCVVARVRCTFFFTFVWIWIVPLALPLFLICIVFTNKITQNVS